MTEHSQTTFTLGGDLTVRRMGFGAMRITGDGIWGEPKDREGAKKLLHKVLDLGVNLIDTADAYGPRVSENLIREALHPYPKDLVIATKGGLVRGGPNDWRQDATPEHLEDACEESLERLGVETIDLYQLHAVDPAVPLEDSIGALQKLQEQGKIRHIGVSNFDTKQLEKARAIVDVVSVQNRYNLTDRKHEPVLEACEAAGIAFMPWYPMASGALHEGPEALRQLAAKHGVKPGQVALAWLLGRSKVTLPIPGTSSIAHLEENVAAQSIELGDEEIAQLDAVMA